MNDFNLMLELSHYSAYFAAAATALVAYGFVRLACKRNDLIGHLAKGLLLMHAAVFFRTIYWDVVRPLVPDAAWSSWYDLSNESSINLLFNSMVILAGYHSLKSLHMSIPDRENYSLIGAAFYPGLAKFFCRDRS